MGMASKFSIKGAENLTIVSVKDEVKLSKMKFLVVFVSLIAVRIISKFFYNTNLKLQYKVINLFVLF